MITVKTNENHNSIGVSGGVSFEIAKENQAFIIEALSKNIYKDPFGSIIREYCSNAWDANKEAGVEEPILVKLLTDSTGKYFSVTDFGVGLSPERVSDVFVKYGKSTKGQKNSEIGGFGIGAKSAFSYTDSFFVNTVYNGVLYKYLLTKTEANPKMILLSEEKTELRNGTEIRLYLNNNTYTYDIENKIRRQLLHFQSVLVDFGNGVESLFGDIKTFEDDDVIVNSISPSIFSQAYLVVGPVSYPINYQLLGLQPIEIPFGIKVAIGTIDVTLSREEIRYSEETIEILKKKIQNIKLRLQEFYNDRNWTVKSAKEYYEKNKLTNSVMFGEVKINFSKDYKKITRGQYNVLGIRKDVRLPKDDTIPFLKIYGIFSQGKLTTSERNFERLTFSLLQKEDYVVYLCDEKVLSHKKLAYISEIERKKILLLKYNKLNYYNYKQILVKDFYIHFEESNFSKRIIQYKKLFENSLIKELNKLSKVEISQEFLDRNKIIQNTNKSDCLFKVKYLNIPFGESYRNIDYHFNFFKFQSEKIDLKKNRFVLVENEEDFEKVRKILSGNLKFYVVKNNRMFYRFVYTDNKKHLQQLKENEQIISFEKFFDSLKPYSTLKKEIIFRYFEQNFQDYFSRFFLTKIEKLNNQPRREYSFNYQDESFFKIYKPSLLKEENIIPFEYFTLKRKIERFKKSIKITDFIIWDYFDFKKKECADFLRQKALLPSLNSFSPINEDEIQFLKEIKQKQKYKQSLLTK